MYIYIYIHTYRSLARADSTSPTSGVAVFGTTPPAFEVANPGRLLPKHPPEEDQKGKNVNLKTCILIYLLMAKPAEEWARFPPKVWGESASGT